MTVAIFFLLTLPYVSHPPGEPMQKQAPGPVCRLLSVHQGLACPATWDAGTRQKAAQAPLLNAEKGTIKRRLIPPLELSARQSSRMNSLFSKSNFLDIKLWLQESWEISFKQRELMISDTDLLSYSERQTQQ